MPYAGSDWVKNRLKYYQKGDQVTGMSELGEKVADLLGDLFKGIYHIEKHIKKVDWTNKHYIEITIGWHDWATFDFDDLTRLVFLAHWMCIRVEMNPCNFTHIKLVFHQRKRDGSISQRHPTIDQAVEMFKKTVTLQEYTEK